MGKTSTPKGDAGHTLGDYPNAANIREWMRQYFGTTGLNVDIRFTFWNARGELPEINTPAAALHFGLSRGYRLTDAGRAKAYELGILSDDSPAVPIQPKSIFQKPFSGTASASQIEGRIKLEQLLNAQLKETQKRSAFLTGIQKTWIAAYLHGATGEEPYTGRIGVSNNFGVIMCPRWRDVLKAIEDPEQELSQDFDARALLEWAKSERLTLTTEGLAAWERLNTTKEANTERGKASESGLAARLGVTSWQEIEASMDASGTIFNFCKVGAKGGIKIKFSKLGFRRTGKGYRLLCMLAESGNKGVPIKHNEYADDATGAHRNLTLRLNEKFSVAFGIKENLLDNSGCLTTSNFAVFYMKKKSK